MGVYVNLMLLKITVLSLKYLIAFLEEQELKKWRTGTEEVKNRNWRSEEQELKKCQLWLLQYLLSQSRPASVEPGQSHLQI